MSCKGRNEDSTPCRSGVVLGNGYCLAHQDQAPDKPARWTRERIEAAIAAHGGPMGLDLTGADLSNLDLSGMDLHGIILGPRIEESRDEMRTIEPALLQGTDFYEANLQGAYLEHANLQKARLVNVSLQDANLFRAKLQEAKLRGANLQEASLCWANLQGADLRFANLQEADLSHASLQGADLRFADLRGVDLLDIEAGGLLGTRLHRAKLDHTPLKREQLGPGIGDEQAGEYREAREAYLALKQNFDNWGDYAASAWAYQKERKMEKATKAPWRCRNSNYYGEEKPFPRLVRGLFSKLWPNLRQYGRLPRWSPLIWWFWFKYTVKWLADWFVELLCGYGESIWRVLLWMGVALFGFATYYWYIGGVKLVNPIPGPQATATSFLHYLIYSVGAFTTTGFARFQPAHDLVRLITAFQAIIGIFLAGLLGFVAGNRIRRS